VPILLVAHGARGEIRTLIDGRFKRPAYAVLLHARELVWDERFELPASPKEIQIYSLAQPTVSDLSHIGGELGSRTQSPVTGWRVSSALACRLPRSPWRETSDSNAVIAGLESAALPIEPVSQKLGGERRNRTPILSERRFSGPVADHSARALRFIKLSKNFWWARRDLNSHPEGLVSKTSAAASYATGPHGPLGRN
jgi:hypothetical protein